MWLEKLQPVVPPSTAALSAKATKALRKDNFPPEGECSILV